jgi:hypothetical protein
MKIFPLTIYVLLKPFIQILPSDSKKSLWDSRTTATLVVVSTQITVSLNSNDSSFQTQTTVLSNDSSIELERQFLFNDSSLNPPEHGGCSQLFS